jgi:predicted nucleic acid-binding protein
VSLVVDANVLAALALSLPYSEQAAVWVSQWTGSAEDLLAPVLQEYELAALIRKAVVLGWLTTEGATHAMDKLLDLRIERFPPTPSLHKNALHWAQRLSQSKTYDAHYLALAEQEGVELWTADRRLANAARSLGAKWVRWIGETAAANPLQGA